jgi:hypothetical protein
MKLKKTDTSSLHMENHDANGNRIPQNVFSRKSRSKVKIGVPNSNKSKATNRTKPRKRK